MHMVQPAVKGQLLNAHGAACSQGPSPPSSTGCGSRANSGPLQALQQPAGRTSSLFHQGCVKMHCVQWAALPQVRVLSSVKHERIVGLLGACLALPHICIVEELITGGSLFDRLHCQDSHHSSCQPLPYHQVSMHAAVCHTMILLCMTSCKCWRLLCISYAAACTMDSHLCNTHVKASVTWAAHRYYKWHWM